MAARGIEHFENQCFRFSFDRRGRLHSIRNLASGAEYLGDRRTGGNPFALYYDFSQPYEFRSGGGGTPERPVDPQSVARGRFAPADAGRVSCERTQDGGGSSLVLRYRQAGGPWEVVVTIAASANAPTSTWRMSYSNTGSEPLEAMATFPFLSGVRIEGSGDNMMTVNDQAGYVCPLWMKEGGVYGNGNFGSMQWGSVWNDGSRDVLAFIVKDAELRNKEIAYRKPSIEVRYFPPQIVQPGEWVELPEAEIMVYSGTWRQAARAYREWFSVAFPPAEHPRWLPGVDAYMGRWFEKHGKLYPRKPSGPAEPPNAMESFEELPQAYRRVPLDMMEWAFFCRQSMVEKELDGRMVRVHTDGINDIREDLGGTGALRRGVEAVHRMGHRLTLYVEAYIVPGYGELAGSTNASDWAVTNSDGSQTGNYSWEHWLHMCPGCVQWQDHLARTCARLIRETDADGIRLDSLGCYFFPCYNPKHHHQSPFDYNRWARELLARVAAAVRAVKPDTFLATEGPVDFYGSWFNSAYTSQGIAPDYDVATADVAPMRVAVPSYALFTISGGPVAASLLGYPGGNVARNPGLDLVEMEENWSSVRYAVADILRHGEVADVDPRPEWKEIVCRRFTTPEVDAIVGARPSIRVEPDCYRRMLNERAWAVGGYRNSEVNIKRGRLDFALSFAANGRDPACAYLCDVETLSVRELHLEREGDEIRVHLASNWFMIAVCYGTGRPLSELRLPGGVAPGSWCEVAIELHGRSQPGPLDARLHAPALDWSEEPAGLAVKVPTTMRLKAPQAPGKYQVRLEGEGMFGCKRYLAVG